MKKIYFALLKQDNVESYCVLTNSSSIEELQKEFDEDVRAVCGVEIEDNQRAMLETLLQIDSVTNTCLVQDLVAALFTAGYHFGR